jgi:two-component system, NtrC family, response regulator GlrR
MEQSATARGHTEELDRPPRVHGRWGLVIGRGSEARHRALGDRPVTVGSAMDNQVVLSDRAVSARHCLFEQCVGGARVRDLGSRNGTWVEGVRVEEARVQPGTRVRVGRTDLVVVARGPARAPGTVGVVAESPSMVEVMREVERFARLSWPVLIEGESGSGKEGLAQALHERGPRARGPFVAINGGGLPGDLIESELFGHARGAFTGAVAAHRGVFEQAEGGTLFLDEVGELPLSTQARLLRVLETWEVRRVGGEAPVRVDVRLVCATHRNLRELVGRGQFREDLYYRMARLVLEVPPLRARPEDVRALTEHFLAQLRPEVGVRSVSRGAMARLLMHPFRGNARELKNVLSVAAASAPSAVLDADDVERAIRRLGGGLPGLPAVAGLALHDVLEQYGGNVSATARALGVPRSTLRDRLSKHGPSAISE